MLSQRLILLSCALVLALASATSVSAWEVEAPGAPSIEAGAPPAEPDEGRPTLGVILHAVREEAHGAEDAATDASEAVLDEATVLIEDTVKRLDDTVKEAEGLIEDAQEDAERRLGDVTEIEPETDDAPEYEPAPSASIAEPISLTEPMMVVAATAAAAAALFWLAGSTGLGASQAGSAATHAAKDLRKLLPYASPMFTRFERDTVLGHPKRESLYAEIMTRPGITLQDLCEETGLSRTAVSHHLRLLEQQHLIVSKRVGRSRHFFENGGRYGRDQKEAYAVLHNDRSKDVHRFIADHPGAIQKDVCSALGIQASVAHWHVKRLEEASLIEAVRQGRTVSYFPMQATGYA